MPATLGIRLRRLEQRWTATRLTCTLLPFSCSTTSFFEGELYVSRAGMDAIGLRFGGLITNAKDSAIAAGIHSETSFKNSPEGFCAMEANGSRHAVYARATHCQPAAGLA